MKKKEYYRKLRVLRETNNLSYEELAKELNMSTSYYWQLENKKRNLYYNTAVKIAKYFKLKPDDIFYE